MIFTIPVAHFEVYPNPTKPCQQGDTRKIQASFPSAPSTDATNGMKGEP